MCRYICLCFCPSICIYIYVYMCFFNCFYCVLVLILKYRGEYLGVYAAFGVGQIILTLFGSYFLALGGVFAATVIHKRLLVNILRLPMSFFDTTPSGRILNRFSKDINTIDETIPQCAEDFIFNLFIVIDTIVVISYATPWFIIVIIPLTIAYLLIQVRIMLCSVTKLYFSCSDFMWPLRGN